MIAGGSPWLRMVAVTMPVLELMTSSGLGSLLGMRHALEPDHLAAVSTLVTGERSSSRAAFLGACWGLGHTLTLVTAGAMPLFLRAAGSPAGAHGLQLHRARRC